jgi:hypothetical protein
MTYTEPIGASTDALFTLSDLQQIVREFSDSTATYLNPASDVACINVPWQSGDQQCAPKAEPWIAPAYVVPTTSVIIPPPSIPPPAVSTPEPSMICFLVVAALLVRFSIRRRIV